MNNWLLYAITAPAIFAIVNFIDKFVLEKYIKDYRGMPIFSTIIALIFGTFFWIASGFPLLELKDGLLVLLTGIFTIWGMSFYFEALSKEQTSTIIILFQLIPIFVLILSLIFLGDSIELTQLIGFALLLLASIGVSVKRDQNLFKFSPAFVYILIADLLWAISYVIFKFVIDANSFVKVVSYESWGIGLGGILMYVLIPQVRKAFWLNLKKIRKNTLALIFLNEALFIAARLLTFTAISLGPVFLVTILGETQVFWGILYGLILTKLFGKIFKEDTQLRSILQKIVFASFAFIGIYLIN